MTWARVPAFLARRVPSDRPASEMEAWVDLLTRWQEGEEPGPRELIRAWSWGAGRVMRFVEKVAAWARQNGARAPERNESERKRNESERTEHDGGPIVEEERNESERERNDSRARDPYVREREERDDHSHVAADRHDGVPADALPSPADPPAPVVPAEPEAQPGDGGDLDAAGGGSDEAGGPAVAGGEGKPLTADVLAVWEAWRAFHPSARATPSKGAARMLRGALKAATAEQLASAIRWAHLAPHPRASYLRGVEYEAGESNVGAYLGIENLLVAKNLDTRVAWAAEWEAQGSPDYRDQPREMPTRVEELTAKDRRAIETMRYLIDGVDVADHADPDYARAILRAWNDCPGTAGITATRSTPAQFLDAALIAELRRIRAWVALLPKGVTDAR